MPNPFGQMSLRAVGGSSGTHAGNGGISFPLGNTGLPPMMLPGFVVPPLRGSGLPLGAGPSGLPEHSFVDLRDGPGRLGDHDRLSSLTTPMRNDGAPPEPNTEAAAEETNNTYFSGRKIVNNVVTRISTPYSVGPLPCPYACGRSFKHATQKAIHVRKAHTGERPFVCGVDGCERAFHSSGDLKSHEKTHSGTREHSCGVCGKQLSSRNALRVHEKALHTLERPFTCEEQNCGMTYMTKLDLDRHAAKHAKSKEREVKQKLSSLEKRAVKAERLVKQLRDKFVKLEKRGGGSGGGVWDRFGVVKGLLGGIGGIGGIGGPGQALGGDGSRSASGCELKEFSKFSVAEVDDLLLKHAAGDDFVVVRRGVIGRELQQSYSHQSPLSHGKSSSRGLSAPSNITRSLGAEASGHGRNRRDDDAPCGDPTVQGVFLARDALAAASEETDDDDEDVAIARLLPSMTSPDERSAPGVGASGGDERLLLCRAVGKKRSRAVSEDPLSSEKTGSDRKRNALSPAVLKRRVLEKLMRLEYEAGEVKESIPFQSWRRGLSEDAKKRLERDAEAEMLAGGRTSPD